MFRRRISGGRREIYVSGSSGAYRGDVDAAETWLRLAEEGGARLIDVRSRAEWSYVGLPDLSAIGKVPLLVEWVRFPDMQANESFVDEVAAALSAEGVGQDEPLFFLCRSGARSAAAAAAMTGAGYQNCFNVAGGFEGRLDVARHRGTVEGWKAAGLPWVQS